MFGVFFCLFYSRRLIFHPTPPLILRGNCILALVANDKPLTSINLSGSDTQVSELADSIVTGRIAGNYPANNKVLTLELC